MDILVSSVIDARDSEDLDGAGSGRVISSDDGGILALAEDLECNVGGIIWTRDRASRHSSSV